MLLLAGTGFQSLRASVVASEMRAGFFINGGGAIRRPILASATAALLLGRLSLLGLGLTVCIGACHMKPQTATVQGDVYLVMQSGDVKRGAGNIVHLLPDSDSLHVAMARACSTFATDGGRLWALKDALCRYGISQKDYRKLLPLIDLMQAAGRDSVLALRARARTTMQSIFSRQTIANAPTGINAHFRFDHVKPGKYVLWAVTTIGDHHYTWWAPIVVHAGDSLKKDLDNSSEGDSSIYCPPLAYFERNPTHTDSLLLPKGGVSLNIQWIEDTR